MKRTAAIPHLIRAVNIVWKSSKGWTIAGALLMLVQGILPLVTLYLMKILIDSIIGAEHTTGAAIRVLWVVVAFGGATLLGAILSSIERLIGEMQVQSVADYMYEVLHNHSVAADLEYYENPDYYDTLHRAQEEAPYRPVNIVTGFQKGGQSFVSLCGIGVLLLSFHWSILLVLVAAAVPGIFIQVRYARKFYNWGRSQSAAERKSLYLNWMLTSDTHAKEIRLFGLGKLFMDRFQRVRQRFRRERLILSRNRSIAESVTEAISLVAVMSQLAIQSVRAVQGAISPGDLVMFYQAIQRGWGYLGSFLRNCSELYEDSLFLKNLFEFLDLKPRIVDSPQSLVTIEPIRQGISFDSVSFAYPTGNRTVLKDISLSIRPGEHIALVGENGAGKTTIVKLLSRLYDPTSGAIRFDTTDIRDFQLEELRRQVSVVFQDFAHYQFSARENIRIGDISCPSDSSRIQEAAMHAGIHNVIAKLPLGYNTPLGKWFADGEELSIGEWQKIAIARAFLRPGQILILDEPTSALDPIAEYEVFRRFHELAAGRTAIVISHRLSSVRMVDRIYVLRDGTIAESGTHDELVRKSGAYAHLFETQAKYYR